MKEVLISVGAVVGLVAVFEVGLLFFPWTYSPHLVSRPLTLAEKNQRLWERFAPIPSGTTEASQPQDAQVEALIDRVQELEARIAEMDAHNGTSQECSEVRREAMSMPSRFRYGFIEMNNCATESEQLAHRNNMDMNYQRHELQRLESKIRDLEMN
jgi:hypothetical protein